MDNIIKNRPESAKPAVHMTWGDQTFIGNTYTVMNPVVIHGRQRSLDEKVVEAKVIDTQGTGYAGAFLPTTAGRSSRSRLERAQRQSRKPLMKQRGLSVSGLSCTCRWGCTRSTGPLPCPPAVMCRSSAMGRRKLPRCCTGPARAICPCCGCSGRCGRLLAT